MSTPQLSLRRISDEMAQAWNIAIKDIRTYYLQPPMIMFGLLLPFFMFFSFSIKRDVGAESGIARLLALTTFFTASSAGPVIIPLERRMGTYNRLLAAPMSLATLLLGKTLVGAFFALVTSLVPLLAGVLFLKVQITHPVLLILVLFFASLVFSAFGLVFASIPVQSVGSIMMPSTLIRWPLLFISGIFIPLAEMAPWSLILAHFSPLTYAQDLFNYVVLGDHFLNLYLDFGLLVVLLLVFLILAAGMHRRSKRLGY